MGEKIYTLGDRKASIIEFVFLLIRSEKSKIIIKRWNATTYEHFTGTIRHTYTQQTTQHIVVATFQFFDAGCMMWK